MASFGNVVVVVTLAATLVLILWRPHGISEAWIALAGGAAMVVIGAVRPADLPPLVRSTADVLLFLAGMMLLTVVVEQAGVFEVLAEGCASLARGSGVLLFVVVFVLGAVVTALLSLDVTVVVLTPIVYTIAIRRRIHPLPYLFACTFVANTASLVLPVSNLTNLLLYQQLDLDFVDFARTMWFPNLVAMSTNLILFLVLFRHDIPRHFSASAIEPLSPRTWWFWISSLVLTLTLMGLLWAGITHASLAAVAMTGALILYAIGFVTHRFEPRAMIAAVSWPVLAFVVGMLVLISGFESVLGDDRTISAPDNLAGAIIAGATVTATGSNIVNNVPIALLAIPFVERSEPEHREALTYSVLLGSNIGPTLTTYGSLATMIWLSLIRKRGLHVTTRQYLRVGAISMPPVLIASMVALWVTLR